MASLDRVGPSLIQRTEHFIEEVNNEIRSNHRIIDCLDQPILVGNKSIEFFKNFAATARVKNIGWKKVIQYIGHQKKIDIIFNLLMKEEKIERLSLVLALGKTGLGQGSELNGAGMVKLSNFANTVFVGLGRKNEQNTIGHAFLVLNPSEVGHEQTIALTQNEALGTFFQDLPKDAIIADFLLGFACSSHELKEKGKKLFDLMEHKKLTIINTSRTIRRNAEKEITQTAERYFVNLKKKLSELKAKNAVIDDCGWSQILAYIGMIASADLMCILPNTFWHFDHKSDLKALFNGKDDFKAAALNVYMISSKSETDEVSSKLQQKGIVHDKPRKVVNKSTYCIVIHNPDLDQLNKLNPEEDVESRIQAFAKEMLESKTKPVQ